MNFNKFFIFGFSAMVLASCNTQVAPTLTPLEIRSIQTREYDTDQDIVFKSVVSVFQDLGYMITNANVDTGIISAESSTESNPTLATLFGIAQMKQVKATAVIEKIKDYSLVRLSFVEVNKSSGSGMNNRYDTPLLDAQLYTNAFEKIASAIFLRNSR